MFDELRQEVQENVDRAHRYRASRDKVGKVNAELNMTLTERIMGDTFRIPGGSSGGNVCATVEMGATPRLAAL